MYKLENDRVVDKEGRVAIQHRNSNGANITVSGTTYVFVPKKNVSMAWVQPQHVDRILQESARICCGKQDKKFRLASLINVNLWETGDRNGNQ